MSKNESSTILGYEDKLWQAADKLRGSMDSSEYKHVVLGLIFLKYVSDAFETKYQELLKDEYADEEDKDEYTAENIFWVPKIARWNEILRYANTPEIGKVIDNAMESIEKENPSLKGVLNKNYSRPELEKTTLGELVTLFTNIEIGTDKAKEMDMLGRVYEYFLSKFASAEGKGGGEFYTPTCIVKTLVEMIEPFKGRVYDPCCGSGGMFVQSANFVNEHQGNINNISVYGQELNATTWRLAKMNLAIRGIEADLGDSNGDTFHDDKHKALRADYILANPPFNIKDYGQESLLEDPRWKYDVPPKNNANYAWIQHIISKLSPKGVAGFVLANGSLSTTQKQEYNIRKAMIEDDIVDCIITLPDKLFYTTGIPVSLWFLRKQKTRDNKVLFIDLREKGTMIDRRVRELTKEEIKETADIYHNWLKNENYEDIKGYCYSASLEEIKNNDYSLVSGRYVGIDDSNEMSQEEIEEQIKIVSKELKDLLRENQELAKRVEEILDMQ